MDFTSMDSTNYKLKIFEEKFQKVPKKNLNLLHTSNPLHSIFFVLATIYIPFSLYSIL